MNFIKNLFKKFNSKTNNDWAELDNPIKFVPAGKPGMSLDTSDSIVIPADGNNECFSQENKSIIPPRRNTSNKKYFFVN